jgi:hypothetical protein
MGIRGSIIKVELLSHNLAWNQSEHQDARRVISEKYLKIMCSEVPEVRNRCEWTYEY